MNSILKPDQPIQAPGRTTSGTSDQATPWAASRILLAIGAAGPIAFLGIAALAGLLAPGYDVLTQAMSDLAVGPNGWLMTINFFAFGLTIIAFAFGFYGSLSRGSRVGTLLLVIVGLAIFGAGIFPTDLKGAPETEAGGLHNLLFLVMMLALILSYCFSALALRRQAGWRAYARYTALMPVLVFALLAVFIIMGSDPGDPLYSIAGIIQRALLGLAFGWISVTAGRLLRTTKP